MNHWLSRTYRSAKAPLILAVVIGIALALRSTPVAVAVEFEPVQTLQPGIDFITALALGPEDPDPATLGDGCIYAVSGDTGIVRRICFDGSKFITSDTIVIDLNGASPVEHALGIAIDPRSRPETEIHLYVAYVIDSLAPFHGRIARAVSTDGGTTYAVDEVFITGLPTFEEGQNQSNGLDFGSDGCLYIAQGSSSNSGYDRGYSESRLSGAILRACFTDAAGALLPGFDRDCGDGPDQEACDVDVYASGLRNPYDLVWHSNGRLYSTDNDPSLGFHLDCGIEANNYGCPCQEPVIQPIGDELNLIEEDMYYGAPNPFRAIPTGLQCEGGSNAGDVCTDDLDCGTGTCEDLSALCTDAVCGDTAQCYYFGFGEDPLAGEDPNGIYRSPIAQVDATLEGITEYRSRFDLVFPGSFCSDWDGQLLATGAPGLMQRFSLSADGLIATPEGQVNLPGAEGLDVVVGPDGTIYLADFAIGRVAYLMPIEQPDQLASDFFIADCQLGQHFQDDFDRSSLGANWSVDNLSFTITSNQVKEDSGLRFRDAQMRWIGGATDAPSQFGKLQVTNVKTHTWGFLFRAGGPAGEHYEVHLPVGSTQWRWERYDPGFVVRMGDCIGDANVANGDYIGATVEGAGVSTVVKVWRWNTDPDGGDPADIIGSWGPPDCIMTGVAGPYVDTGPTIGLRAYTGSSTANSSADNWSGGDVSAANGIIDVPCTVDADCEDGNVCTDDSCVAGVCMWTNTTLPCDDGDMCTGNDTCAGGVCVSGLPDHCGDGVVQVSCGEQCDDGGTLDGDGCSAVCMLEDTSCIPEITEIIDRSGAGVPNSVIDPDGVITDAAGNVFVAVCGLGLTSEGVFKITPGGVITKIAGGAGDGTNPMTCPVGIDVDGEGNVYAVGYVSNNAFKITPGGVVTQIIGPTGDGTHALVRTLGLVVDESDNVFVTGFDSDNVFKITPGGVITEILNSAGDGANILREPFGIAADGSGNVFVAGFGSDNVFKITPAGTITEIMDATGDGAGNVLAAPHDMTVGGAGNCYVTGNASDNVFEITPGGTITEIIDITGDGVGNVLDNPTGIAVDFLGNVYVAAWVSQNGFRIAPDGVITQIISSSGDGTNGFFRPADFSVAVDSNRNVFMTGTASDNAFKISFLGDSCGDGIVDSCEECDDTGESATCNADCSFASCGDGVLNVTSGEQCEMNGDCLETEFCAADCMCVLTPVCGNLVVEVGEECDDGGQTATCETDCTLPVCGDGVLNLVSGEQCEVNSDCPATEICETDCMCIPAPDCGNLVVETGEDCDDGGQTATCEADCTLPICGDGVLNSLAGETCEDDTDCPIGDVCQGCACVPAPSGQLFCDDFNRALLGPNWVADNLSFSIAANQVFEDSGSKFSSGQLRWAGGNTDSVDQFGKIQLFSAATDSFGFMFRVNGTPGEHYEIHLPAGTPMWRWERYDPFWVETKSTCVGDGVFSDGDYVGVTIEGTGAATIVAVWRWAADPDGAGAVDIESNWGPPDCVMQGVPAPWVDTGHTIGIRAYAGSSTAAEVADNWCGGDVSAVSGLTPCTVNADCDDADVCNGLEFCDAQNLCQPGTPLPCDDGDACNGEETCDPVVGCQPAAALDCDDNNPCTDDSCSAIAGCQNTNNTAPCDDNLACTIGDVCQTGTCVGVDDCPDGEQCDGLSGTCQPTPIGQLFQDDFDRASLGANWVVDVPSFSIASNLIVEDSGVRFRDAQMRWVGGTTESPDQFGKLQVANQQTHTWGFIFRAGGPTGEHYEVHLPAGASEWRWERYDPGFVERMGDCVGDGSVGADDYLGATMERTGASTIVQVWRWGFDPDAGGPVDIAANWGAPDCIMTGATGLYVDAGTTVGLRSYTGSSTANSSADNWYAGDLSVAVGSGARSSAQACDDGDVCNGLEVRDVSGVCRAGEPLQCDDGNECTDDACDPWAGCVYQNSTSSCDDGLACTSGDYCKSGGCVGMNVCDFGDWCDAHSGICIAAPTGNTARQSLDRKRRPSARKQSDTSMR